MIHLATIDSSKIVLLLQRIDKRRKITNWFFKVWFSALLSVRSRLVLLPFSQLPYNMLNPVHLGWTIFS